VIGGGVGWSNWDNQEKNLGNSRQRQLPSRANKALLFFFSSVVSIIRLFLKRLGKADDY
jgi:hypothetical protein